MGASPNQPVNRWTSAGPTLLLLVTAAAYSAVVRAGFVWDDFGLVVGNRLTGSLANTPRFFQVDLWDGALVEGGISGYYRPLMLLSLAVDRALYGLSPVGAHLQSLAWHLLAVWALHRLLRRFLDPPAALLGAAVFALHPCQSEVVAWVSARNDAMAAAFAFLALGLCQSSASGPLRLLGILMATAAAGLSKESVVLLPLMLLTLDLALERRPDRRYLAVGFGLLLVFGLRALAGVGGAVLPSAEGWRMLGHRLPQVVGTLGASLVVPWPLSGTRDLHWLGREPTWRILFGLLAVAGWIALCLRHRGVGRSLARAGLAWTLLAVAPVVIPIADKGLLGDRFTYLAMAGIGISLASLVQVRRIPVLLVLAIGWLLVLHARLPDWSSDLALWRAAVRQTPSPGAWTGLGHALMEAGEPEEAGAWFVAALEDPEPDLSCCPQVIGAPLAADRPALAVQLGYWAAERGCGGVAFHARMGEALLAGGAWELAAARFARIPVGSSRRDAIIGAALARWSADEGRAAAWEAAWTNVKPIEGEVAALLEHAPEHEESDSSCEEGASCLGGSPP